MTEKELKKLNRQELLEILLAQSKMIDRLQAKLKDANEKLAERELKISEAGSIAEASLVLNHIFEDAQKAADQYLENIRRMHDSAMAEADQGGKATYPDDTTVLTDEPATLPSCESAADELVENQTLSEEARADRAAAAEERLAAEADRKTAAEYLEEAHRIKAQTESECTEKRKQMDKQIRVTLLRTKKAVRQMMTLYADEVTRRMVRLKEWDRQMEALHERKIEKQSSKSQ